MSDKTIPLPKEKEKQDVTVEVITQTIIEARVEALRTGDKKVLQNLQDGDPRELARKIVQGRKEKKHE